MEHEDNKLKDFILNKPLTSIEFYNTDQGYMAVDEEHTWIIDAGVQLGFGDALFSFGWNSETQQYEQHYGKLETLADGMEIGGLDAASVPAVHALISQQISNAEIVWNWYSELDENYEPTDVKHYIPMGILLHFSNGSTLQLAGARYQLDIQTQQLKNVIYDSESQLLVSVDKIIEIRQVNDSHLTEA